MKALLIDAGNTRLKWGVADDGEIHRTGQIAQQKIREQGLASLTTRLPRRVDAIMVSNVAGIQQPLYFCGAQMVSMYGMGPVIDQAGLFHAVFSYDGKITFTFTACREMLPDPAFYAECLQASCDELKAAALEPKAKKRKKATKKAKKKTVRKTDAGKRTA